MLVCKKDKKHNEFILVRNQVYKAAVDDEMEPIGPISIECLNEIYKCSVCGADAYDDEVYCDG